MGVRPIGILSRMVATASLGTSPLMIVTVTVYVTSSKGFTVVFVGPVFVIFRSIGPGHSIGPETGSGLKIPRRIDSHEAGVDSRADGTISVS